MTLKHIKSSPYKPLNNSLPEKNSTAEPETKPEDLLISMKLCSFTEPSRQIET